MPNPVVLPPPNWVLKPKTNTTSGVVLYIFASFSLISVLGTVALPGCRTSTTWNNNKNSNKQMLKIQNKLHQASIQNILHAYHLLPLKQPVCHKLSGPDGDGLVLQTETFVRNFWRRKHSEAAEILRFNWKLWVSFGWSHFPEHNSFFMSWQPHLTLNSYLTVMYCENSNSIS